MAHGPGPLDAMATLVREALGAEALVLAVVLPSGHVLFEVQIPSMSAAIRMAESLEMVAQKMRRDAGS